jgi:HSP20 family protein
MLMKYRPFEDFDDMGRSIRLFQDSVNKLFSEEQAGRPWAPAVDIFETENELVLKADVPDVRLEDIDVRVENGTLTLKGNREFANEQKGKGYHRIERGYGSFVRCFALPESFDPEQINADYKNGVLTVTVAKKEVAKPRSVKVNVKH